MNSRHLVVSGGFLLEALLTVPMFSGCEETLPPREDPQGVLEVSFDGEEAPVVLSYPTGWTLVSSGAGGFYVSVKNLHDEVLQAEEDISIDIEFSLEGHSGTDTTIHGGRSDLLSPWMIQNEDLLTIEPGRSATFFIQWDHAVTRFWDYSHLTFHSGPSYMNWFQSDTLRFSAKGTARFFKNVAAVDLQQIDFGFIYIILVSAPFEVQIDSLRARFDTHLAKVVLDWQTPHEANNYGFSVERSADATTYVSIQFIMGQGSTLDTTYYSYIEQSPLSSGRWYYRLEHWYDFGFIQEPLGYSDRVEVVIP